MNLQEVQIGDKIKFFAIPEDGSKGYHLHKETRGLYKALIARRRPAKVVAMRDDFGGPAPEIYCRIKDKKGRTQHHWLVLTEIDAVCCRKVVPRKK